MILAVPLVVHEWLERTSGWPAARRLTTTWTTLRRLASSQAVIFAALYLTALGLLLATGGFETRVLGQRISVRGLDDIRGSLGTGDRLLIAGEHNDISPSLLRWELGPPMGVECFPVPIAGAARVDPGLATHVLVLAPLDLSAVAAARYVKLQPGARAVAERRA